MNPVVPEFNWEVKGITRRTCCRDEQNYLTKLVK